jgi:hypothetical protein
MQPVVLGDKRGYLFPLACPGKRLFIFAVFMLCGFYALQVLYSS